jgi:hypothetical protein
MRKNQVHHEDEGRIDQKHSQHAMELQSMADDPQHFEKLMQWSEKGIEEIFIKTQDTQKAKFVRLSREARSIRPCK